MVKKKVITTQKPGEENDKPKPDPPKKDDPSDSIPEFPPQKSTSVKSKKEIVENQSDIDKQKKGKKK